MKNAFKAFLTLPFAVIALSGCGGSVNDPSTLKIAFVEAGYGRQFLLDWEEDYNRKNPDMPVKLELDGDAQMTQNILPRLQNRRNLPDIVMVLSTGWQPWSVEGYLEPIDDIYETKVDGDKTVKESLLDNLETFGKVKDHYWALPWSCGPSGIVYNEGMFEQFGWDIPETYNELVALCEKIKTDSAGTIAPFSWSGSTSGYWDFLTFNWWAQVEGEEGWNTFWKFDSPAVYQQQGRLKALQGFAGLVDGGDGAPKNSVPGAAGKKFMEAQMSFVNGEAAMMPNGCWLETEMKNSLPAGFKMKLMKTPVIDEAQDENISYNTCGDFMVIPAGASNKELAKKFLTYTCTKDAIDIFTKAAGGFRPFEYKPSEVEGISDFTKNCADIFESTTKVFMTSDNIMYYQNNCNSWPGYGTPYSKMIQDQDSPEDVHLSCFNYVSSNWKLFQAAAGEF